MPLSSVTRFRWHWPVFVAICVAFGILHVHGVGLSVESGDVEEGTVDAVDSQFDYHSYARMLAGNGTRIEVRSQTPAVVVMFLFYPLFGVVAYACELMAPTKWKGILSIGGVRQTCAARLKLLLLLHAGIVLFVMFFSWWCAFLSLLVCAICYYGFTAPTATFGDKRLVAVYFLFDVLWLVLTIVDFVDSARINNQCKAAGSASAWCGWVGYIIFLNIARLVQIVAIAVCCVWYIQSPLGVQYDQTQKSTVAASWRQFFPVMFSDLKEALMNKRRKQKAGANTGVDDASGEVRLPAKSGGAVANPSFGVTARYEMNPIGAAAAGPPPPPRLARPVQTSGDHSGREASPYDFPGTVVDTKVQPPPPGPFLQEEYTITSR